MRERAKAFSFVVFCFIQVYLCCICLDANAALPTQKQSKQESHSKKQTMAKRP